MDPIPIFHGAISIGCTANFYRSISGFYCTILLIHTSINFLLTSLPLSDRNLRTCKSSPLSASAFFERSSCKKKINLGHFAARGRPLFVRFFRRQIFSFLPHETSIFILSFDLTQLVKTSTRWRPTQSGYSAPSSSSIAA